MTKVKISDSQWKTEIEIKGHAGYNPNNDIVCAAISNTAYMLLNYLLDYEYMGIVESYKDEPGDFRLSINRCADNNNEVELSTALRMFRIGIEQIAINYPKNCKLEVTHDAI